MRKIYVFFEKQFWVCAYGDFPCKCFKARVDSMPDIMIDYFINQSIEKSIVISGNIGSNRHSSLCTCQIMVWNGYSAKTFVAKKYRNYNRKIIAERSQKFNGSKLKKKETSVDETLLNRIINISNEFPIPSGKKFFFRFL